MLIGQHNSPSQVTGVTYLSQNSDGRSNDIAATISITSGLFAIQPSVLVLLFQIMGSTIDLDGPSPLHNGNQFVQLL